MSHSNNPFVRGYDGLSVQRLLAISYDDDWRSFRLSSTSWR